MKRKNKKKRSFSPIFFIFIIFVIGTIYYLNKNSNQPEYVLKQYMSYINEQKYDEMYELLSEESKAKTSIDTFITRNRNIYEGIEATNLKLKTIVKEEELKVSYQTEMDTVAGVVTFANTMTFEKEEDKKYYINWNSSLIFPELTDTDKVRVNTVHGERGSILDRNGILLAKQGIVKSIGFIPGKIKNRESAVSSAAKLLNISEKFINDELNASYVGDNTFVPLKTLLNAEAEKIEDYLLQIPGIMISDKKVRVYPYEETTSHLLGYVRKISSEELEENKGKGYTSDSIIGKIGIEKAFEDILKGRNGSEIYIVDSNGERKKTIAKTEKKNGKDIKLTIDINLQKKIYEQFKSDNGLSVAMNPKTGEVLAMVSTPTFNSNDFILGFTNEEWEALNNNKNNPMFCRFQSSWIPGSSFKPITGAIGLTTGKMTPTEDYGKSGTSWQNNESWGSYKITTLKTYNTPANLKNALIYSDNIYFAKSALKIGEKTLSTQLLNIGFDDEIPFILNMSSSQFAENNKFSSEIQLADTGYGQGKLLVNPLHMASVYSAFVNEGNMIKPYIQYSSEPKIEYWIENAFTKEASETIKEALIQVVENANGTAYEAKIEGMIIAGKTGTAEIKSSQDDKNGTEIGWFNAFRVTEKPNEQLLIINMIEDVKDRGGSHYLLQKVKKMFQ